MTPPGSIGGHPLQEPKTELEGEGTPDTPFIVTWARHDSENPMLWSKKKKWGAVVVQALATLIVAFGSSVYEGGLVPMVMYFRVDLEVITLGLSLYVLGFAFGPLIWAPLSEVFGRRPIFTITVLAFTLFHVGCGAARNIQTLLLCRFFAGFFGSSLLSNAGGVISDMFDAKHRAKALALFSMAPFAGPVLGPIVGGYIGQYSTWRWLFWVETIISGVIYFLGLWIPETYTPVLLTRRAKALSAKTGQVYVSIYDLPGSDRAKSPIQIVKTALTRPFILLFLEPICAMIAVYAAVIFGTLYLMFGAYPIVFEEVRGWGSGSAGLPFIGIGIGMGIGLVISGFFAQHYGKALERSGYPFSPEARLPGAMVGGVLIPIGLFWFAWTVTPRSIPWIVPVLGSVPFGAGMNLIFLSLLGYLVDTYTLYSASALAANAVFRSLFGFAFPLFTKQRLTNLGINWGLTLVAFLGLACMPIPFLLYKWGANIRTYSKFALSHSEIEEKEVDRISHCEEVVDA